jgi:serine/threonine-protein kinase HipA
VSAADRDVLLVRRFDREKVEGGYRRARMVSALTLLGADDSPSSRERWSYVLLAEELRRACATPRREAHELFRRMCFNALISNSEDHPRNQAVLAFGSDGQLSPAYDLTPSTPVSEEHRDRDLACGDFGRYANAQNLLTQAARFLLSRDEASALLEGMKTEVQKTWYGVARSAGVSERDCEAIRRAFVYPGFSLALAGHP